MADWTDITNSQVDPDAPLTSELAYAWRDNVIAMSEGANGAPRISRKALTKSFIAKTSATAANPVAFVGLGGITFIEAYVKASWGSADSAVQFSTTADGGSTWSGWSSMTSTSNSGSASFMTFFDFISGTARSYVFTGSYGNDFSFTPVPNINGIRFRNSSAFAENTIYVCLVADGGE